MPWHVWTCGLATIALVLCCNHGYHHIFNRNSRMIAAGKQIPLLASFEFRRVFINNPLTVYRTFGQRVWPDFRVRNGFFEGGI